MSKQYTCQNCGAMRPAESFPERPKGKPRQCQGCRDKAAQRRSRSLS